MIVTTRVVYASIDDFINGAKPLEWQGYAYVGPIAILKKGRNNLQTAANQGNTNTSNALGTTSATNRIANQEVNTAGGLSPMVSKQLANEKAQIGKAYSSAAGAADRGLTMRGMGAAPSGMTASLRNSAINNAGEAQTGATGNAFETQNRLNQTAYDPVIAAENATSGSVNAATNAGQALNKAGSTLGDIGSGLGTIAGIGSKIIGLGGLSGIGGKLMGGNGGNG